MINLEPLWYISVLTVKVIVFFFANSIKCHNLGFSEKTDLKMKLEEN